MASALVTAFGRLRGFVSPGALKGCKTANDLLMLANASLVVFEAGLDSAFDHAQRAYDQGRGTAIVKKDIRSDGSAFGAQAFQQIRQITDQQRQQITTTVQGGFAAGQSLGAVAIKLRDGLGLTDTQAQAVANYRTSLEANSGAALDYGLRNARYDAAVTDAVDSNTPLSQDQIDSMVDAYAQRTLAMRAMTIARYETLSAANAGGFQAVQDAIDAAGIDPASVVKHWMITDDEATCPVCRSIVDQNPDGVPLTEDFTWTYKSKKKSYSGTVTLPPEHPNCLPGYTLVSPSGRITGVSERLFDGEITVLRTATGEELTVTPNHPVLSGRGWIAAGALVEGDQVVCRSGLEWAVSGADYDEYAPAPIQQVAQAFRSSCGVAPREVPVTRPDFHGDSSDGQVAVIWANWDLPADTDPCGVEELGELSLVGARSLAVEDIFGERHLGLSGIRNGAPCGGNMRSAELPQTLVGGHTGPLGSFGVAPTRQLDLVGLGDPVDDATGHSELLGDRHGRGTGAQTCDHSSLINGSSCRFGPHDARVSQANSPSRLDPGMDRSRTDAELAANILKGAFGPVLLDDVVQVRTTRFRGHVYNLETTDGFYVAQSIIVHNCRCTATYEVNND